MENLEIRCPESSEIEACALVIRRSFGTVAEEFGLTRENCPTNAAFLTRERLEADLAKGAEPSALFVDGQAAGYVQLERLKDGRYALERLAVLPEYRSRGYGERLLDRVVEQAKSRGGAELTIGIMEENRVLKEWYIRHGFRPTGVKKFPHIPFAVGFLSMNLTEDPIPRRLGRKAVYENEWVNLYLDEVRYPDGTIIPEHHLLHYDYVSAAVVLERENGDILLIRTGRYVTQSVEWELPAGRSEAGESALEAAARETEEETGYSLENIRPVSVFYPSDGMSDLQVHLYRARAGFSGAIADTTEVREVRWFSRQEIKQMLLRGQIHCGISIAGLGLVLLEDASAE